MCIRDSVDGELPAQRGHGRTRSDACLLQPLSDGHAPSELAAITRGHGLGNPPPVTKISEPGLRAHAAVVHSDLNARQTPVLAQVRNQRWPSEHTSRVKQRNGQLA